MARHADGAGSSPAQARVRPRLGAAGRRQDEQIQGPVSYTHLDVYKRQEPLMTKLKAFLEDVGYTGFANFDIKYDLSLIHI